MTTLGIAIVTASLQAILVGLIAMAAIGWAGRRNPRTGVGLSAAALASCALLLVVAVAPLPEWWTYKASSAAVPSGTVEASSALDGPPISADHGWRIPLTRLASLLPSAIRLTATGSSWSIWAIIGGLFLAGVGFEAVRLLAGLWAVAAIRRRSKSVADASLIAEVNDLRQQFGILAPVTVCESTAVGTAATIGWRRPVVLLADDWATWGPAERRAVIAHELAHVRRGDYPLGLLAFAARAIHFYHPLVRWLAGRLRLHQELAADALAASAAGGRSEYLRSLARMAVRQDAASLAGVARPFLSDRSSLLRRVAMLRVTDDGRPLGRAMRWGLAAALVAAALGASAVRGPAQPPAIVKPPDGQETKELPPFDLSYLPSTAAGFMAVRPAALFSRPELKPIVEDLHRQFRAACKSAGLGPAFDIPFEAIEQVVGPLEIKTLSAEERKKNPHGEGHTLTMGLSMIRMNRDFDWPATLKALAPLATVTEVKPGEFECRHPMFGSNPLTARVVDRRTVAFSVPSGEKAGRDANNAKRWGAAWKEVEGAAIAQVHDNTDGSWTDESDLTTQWGVLHRPAHLAFGVYGGESVAVTCVADYSDALADADVARDAEALRRHLLAELNGKTTPNDAADRMLHGLAAEFLKSFTVHRTGKLVTAEARLGTKWADVLQAFSPGRDGGLKPKVEAREDK